MSKCSVGSSTLRLNLGVPGGEEAKLIGETVTETGSRLVIAPVEERKIPREAIRVDFSDDGMLRVRNLHSRIRFFVGNEATILEPGGEHVSDGDIVIGMPADRVVRISRSNFNQQEEFRTLSHGFPVEDELAVGTMLGQYEIEDCLGRGGMGAVYRARHQFMNRVVALFQA